MTASFDDANTVVRPYLRARLALTIYVTVVMTVGPLVFIAIAINNGQANAVPEFYRWGILGAWMLAVSGGAWAIVATVFERGRPCRVFSNSLNTSIPREPVCAVDRHSAGRLHYEWVNTPAGGLLRPIPGRTHRQQIGAMAWMTCFGTVTAVMLWHFGPRDPGLFGLFGVVPNVMSVIIFPLSIVFGLLFAALMGLGTSREVTCEVHRREERCHISRGPDDLIFPFLLSRSRGIRAWYEATVPPDLDLPVRDLVAVQLCLYLRKLGEKSSDQEAHWSLELNLAHSSPHKGTSTRDPSNSDNAVQRENLLVTSGQFERLIPIATSLAEALRVPLINHATPADFEREKLVGPAREGVRGGWSSH